MILLPEHAQAVQVASKALDPEGMVHFTIRIHATTRMHSYAVIEAIDVDHCKQLLQALDINDVGMAHWNGGDWSLPESPDIEGDQIAYIEGATSDPFDDTEDGTKDDEIEVDMRDPGEPWSWEACELVKRLAKLEIETLTLDQFTDVVLHCRAMCNKEEETDNAATT